jgi:transcription initiation factor TFIIA large subunit
MPQVPNNGNGPRIKTEPGLDMAQGMNMQQNQQYQNQMPPNITSGTAAQRAAQHLHQTYGNRAAASINAIQGAGQQGQNNQHTPQQVAQFQMMRQQQMAQNPGQGMQQGQPGQQRPTEQQYRAMMAQQAASHLQQQQQNAANRNGVGGAQTDGAGDDEGSYGVIKQLGASGEEIMGRVEIDGLIRARIQAMGTTMEGGGLMLPLHKASTPTKRERKVKRTPGGIAQTDGGDDDNDVKDEDLDEDAINSDLDDPDDGLNDEEDEDEGMGHIMLCMYDKVQRVKNKWYGWFFPLIHRFCLTTANYFRLVFILHDSSANSSQEVRHERWCLDREWQGICLP